MANADVAVLPFSLAAVASLLASLISSLGSFCTALLAYARLWICFKSPARGIGSAERVYTGQVFHSRWKPKHHSFRTKVTYSLVTLDRADTPCWANRVALRVEDVRKLASECDSRAFTCSHVLLLAVPPAGGYEQNPLKVYFCVLSNGEAIACVAEVTNTPWGERTAFAFVPPIDTTPKPLHVSPFNCTDGESWRICTSRFPEHGAWLNVSVVVSRRDWGTYFVADLTLVRQADLDASVYERENHSLDPGSQSCTASSTSNAHDAPCSAIGSPQKVSVLIYFNALLLWLKGIASAVHPKYKDRDNGAQLHQRICKRAHSPGAFMWFDATEDPWTRTQIK